MIVEWAIKRIEKEYKEDVAMLLTYGSYENGTANSLSDVDFYFIPKTERAYKLCKTFIVEGIGFDLFPMSWQRVEGLAELKGCLTPCLANVKVLYCNSEEDKLRFEGLQSKLRENLSNKDFMLDKGFSKLEEAMNIYKNMVFEEAICEIRMQAGLIAMALSDGVAYANQTYFSRGLKKQIEDLKAMESTPKDFVTLYEAMIKANSKHGIVNCCYEMIKNTKQFLNNRKEKIEIEEIKPNYEELADLYQEVISTWNKIYVCCDSGNYTLAYISGTCLQELLKDEIEKEYGIENLDLMSYYDANDLEKFKKRAKELQDRIVKVIEVNGVAIDSYRTVEDFIEKNQSNG